MKTRILAAALVLIAFKLGQTQTSVTFPGTIILGTPTDRSVTVNVRANSQFEAYFEYGVSSSVYTAQTTPVVSSADPYAAGYFLTQAVIGGLIPDTRYFNRIRYRTAGSSNAFIAGVENAFHTQRLPGSTFTFCVQGDSHPERANTMFNSDLYVRTLTAAAAEQPDFYITSGDDFSVDNLPTPYTSAAVTGRYTLQLQYFDIVARSAPLFLQTGNHEETSLSNYNLPADSNNGNQVPIWAQNARNRYYAVPAPNDPSTGGFYTGNATPLPGIGLLRDYYAWQWGDALFVVIDPYWSSPAQVDTGLGGQNSGTGKTSDKWAITHANAQYEWLKQTLEQSNAKWKFVFAHHVMGTGRGGVEIATQYEWGGNNSRGSWGFTANRPTWPLPIHQLMVANHVTAFFQGHDHLFAHQQLDGITYQSLPNPADYTYTAFNADAFTSGEVFPNSGFVKVTVSPASVYVEYKRMFLPEDENPPDKVSGMVQFAYPIPLPADNTNASLSVLSGGAANVSTAGSGGTVQTGYATVALDSGSAPYGNTVFSFSQNGIVESEAAVSVSSPTTRARVFVDYGLGVSAGPGRLQAGTVDVYTGIAAVNTGTIQAHVTYTLRDMNGVTLSIGHGSFAPGVHRALFLHQLPDLAADFVLPPDFATAIRFGSLEITSDQPLAIAALRMTINQRFEVLFTTVSIADLMNAPSSTMVYFPHVADGDGYFSSYILLNTSDKTQSGVLRFYTDAGSPLSLHQIGGTTDSVFRYVIPAGGTYLFQTDGSSSPIRTGSLQLAPDMDMTAPVGAGIFSRTSDGVLVTESGIPSAMPTSHARIYVDMASGRDSGLAIAATTSAGLLVTLKAYQKDGATEAGSQAGTLSIAGNGHTAAFAWQWISGLPLNFQGVLDISAPTPFAALTLRAITNSRQDFLITTFPIADMNQSPSAPLVFPHLAVGGGYITELILLSGGSPAATTLNFCGDGGGLLRKSVQGLSVPTAFVSVKSQKTAVSADSRNPRASMKRQ